MDICEEVEIVKRILNKVVYCTGNVLYKKERGATAVEYALMVGLIAMAIIIAVTALGGGISTAFTNIVTRFGAAIPAT